MPTKERLAYIGSRRGERLVRELAEEIRHARLMAGLSQKTVGGAVGRSAATISRLERSVPPAPDIVLAARVARVVGLDLTVRCFPAGGPLRDVAHLQLLRRFLEQLPASVERHLEAPINLPGDLRAWDALLVIEGVRIGIAAETRLRDLQALLRREQAKARDDGVDRLILLVAGTRANRRAIAEAGPMLTTELPLVTRPLLAELRQGRAPTASGFVIL